ncbi:MAG: phosphate acyltransferase PlsX [Bacteroidales bacterium]|nr:phosphate acyltransferase PlsX [Bacteroidales bacterium]MCF8406096.1 phosphate acyltransferase PlsX [Bacteroidales bacterium]
MKIGIDVMGGDYAPDATIEGAKLVLDKLSSEDRIFLFGPKEIIEEKLKEKNIPPGVFTIVHSPEIIGMGERPIRAYTRKPESSISKGLKYLKTKKIDAFSSAGNSGAMLVGAMYSINNIQGVIRPSTLTCIPRENGGMNVMLDIGTNPDIKPDILYQFAILGSIYSQSVLNIKKPKVGLLNIGEEEEKGNLLCQSAFRLMKDSEDFNFFGNIESRDLFKDKVDVIVCDGFTGNIVLKQIEAMYRLMVKRNLVDDYIQKFNYENYGGSPILGVNGSVVIGHGISNAKAIMNMILLSKNIIDARLTQKIKRAMHKHTQSK